MSESTIIKHCSPTLAGLKVGNLFTYFYEDSEILENSIDSMNKKLNNKGIFLKVLRKKDKKALVYVYRLSKLKERIFQKDFFYFLLENGYQYHNTEGCIDNLIYRISASKEFPHEIGVFLGYPLSDIKSFIKYKGKNSKCVGCWKVYTNECEARKLFNKFEKCRRIYREKQCEGVGIKRLTVAM